MNCKYIWNFMYKMKIVRIYDGTANKDDEITK